MSEVFQGRSISGGVAEGEALVTRQGISFLGGVDPDTAAVTEVGHEIQGAKITDKVLVLPSLKGSAAGMWILYRLALKGLAPKAIVTINADAILIAAVVLGEIPTVDQLAFDPGGRFRTGDRLRVDGTQGKVERL